MPFDFQRTRPLLQSGNLTKLFVEELGWEPCRQKLTLRAGESDFSFTAVAEKRGFIVWLCASLDGRLPDHTTRLKLDRALTQTSFEHLIVFATGDFAQQSWAWVRREPGRPLSARTHDYNRAQPGDSLLQKLQMLFVSLEEEEKGELSTITMAGRARAAFDIERVTKAFYRDFDTHRKAFLNFIDGIGEVADGEWYASVMLNRLMFVYFIQRKGFLDADHDYLRNRLRRCKQEHGKDKFYTFYRYFLLRLFHEGFGKRRKDRAPDLEKLLGNIPYLNGGLFDVHELEKPERYGKDIQIPDKAFERVFDYFDQYQWHLDERPLRADNEINPDVLGYIFEKYINQKQMGAYYTKEDSIFADVFGDVLLRVIRPHLFLVDVFLEDVAEDIGIDLVVGAKRAFVQMPLVLVEVIEDALEGFVGNLDVLAVAFGPFEFMHVEQAAVEIRDVAEQFFQVGRAILAAFAEAFVEQAEQEVAVEGIELVLALFLLAAVEPVAEVIGVAVEETLALDEIDEHQAVEHDGRIPFAVGHLADAVNELEEGFAVGVEVAVERLGDALDVERGAGAAGNREWWTVAFSSSSSET